MVINCCMGRVVEELGFCILNVKSESFDVKLGDLCVKVFKEVVDLFQENVDANVVGKSSLIELVL